MNCWGKREEEKNGGGLWLWRFRDNKKKEESSYFEKREKKRKEKAVRSSQWTRVKTFGKIRREVCMGGGVAIK